MDSMGAEVGQKMRSAIKAKLLELSCYVDDELPDYIMVMVANKRTKSQMNEDLNLFLSTKTSTFVEWLHIVLKKLKEVTVTNPEIYKKASKRKLSEVPDHKVKKEKIDSVSSRTKKPQNSDAEAAQSKSLTDNLPITANQLSEQRKITICNESRNNDNVFDDNFDIPLLSEVNMSSEKDLQDIEKKIKSVKSRLGLLVDSDIEEELPEIKSEKDERKNSFQKFSDSNYRTIHLQDHILPSRTTADTEAEGRTAENLQAPTEESTRSEKRNEHKRITFENATPKKPSILERLGSRKSSNDKFITNVRTRISLSEFRKEEEPFLKYFRDSKNEERPKKVEKDWRNRRDRGIERNKRERNTRSSREGRREGSRDRRRDRSNEARLENKKEGILSRLGVMSKVSLPPRELEEPEPEDELKTREVRSMVQVKPRIIPVGAPQPNKNLLLKAVAEAQRSIAQTPNVGSRLKTGFLTSKYLEVMKNKEKLPEDTTCIRKFSQSEKAKLKNLILAQAAERERQNSSDEDSKVEEEYIPKPVKRIPKEAPKYIPSTRHLEGSGDSADNEEIKQQFIITLEGIEKTKLLDNESKPSIKDRLDKKATSPIPLKASIKSRLEGRKSPSPIIFDNVTAKVNTKHNIPDKLPIVHPPLSIKNKERCKYWPSCRQGDKCEFVHPSSNCEMFPHCKFGDNCLYLHPSCKFGTSCTKRECPYSHLIIGKSVSRSASSGVPINLAATGLQTCKFFPNCTNTNCQFYHPKPCKFGKYCKNQAGCSFSHFASSKSSLIWRSK